MTAETRTLRDDPLGGTVRRTVLPNGLRVLTEAVPAMRSVSIGVWVSVGSRDELPVESGAAHFLEHLLFKGTTQRTALEISSSIEAVGGETNAFTTKEYTCYYARVLDEDLALAVDVLGDVITDSLLAEPDVETERGVILEEIAMHEDEPGDEVHDVFARAVYGDHPLGRLISGTTDSVSALTREAIGDFYRSRYTPPAIVVAAAGGLDHGRVVDLVAAAFTADRFGLAAGAPLARRSQTPFIGVRGGEIAVEEKDTEQAHLVLGGAGPVRDDPRRFALSIVNNVLGGGMSSRLFQVIREQRGLAYSVFSYTTQYADSGIFGVYAGCAPGKAQEVLELTRSELDRVRRDGITADELARGKGMLKGSLVLGLEDTGSRMSRLGKGELLHRDLYTVDELLSTVDAVSLDDAAAIAAEVLSSPMSLAVVGPFANHDFTL